MTSRDPHAGRHDPSVRAAHDARVAALPFRTHPPPPGHPDESDDDPVVRLRRERMAARARDAARVELLRAAARNAGLPVVPCALVPTNERPLVPLRPALRDAFVERLRAELAALARSREAGDAPGSPDVSTWPAWDAATAHVLGGACAVCRGACCATAGEHAWLRDAWLVPVRAAAATLDDDAFVARYVARLPDEHHDGSCVFHGANGCVLPTAIRSPLCNHYWCDALVALAREIRPTSGAGADAGGGAAFAVVGAADRHALRRAGALHADGMHPLPLHDATATAGGDDDARD